MLGQLLGKLLVLGFYKRFDKWAVRVDNEGVLVELLAHGRILHRHRIAQAACTFIDHHKSGKLFIMQAFGLDLDILELGFEKLGDFCALRFAIVIKDVDFSATGL